MLHYMSPDGFRSLLMMPTIILIITIIIMIIRLLLIIATSLIRFNTCSYMLWRFMGIFILLEPRLSNPVCQALTSGHFLRKFCGELRRFAETTNPRQNCADRYPSPGSRNSLIDAGESLSEILRSGRAGPRTELFTGFQTGSGQRVFLQKCRNIP